VPDNSIYTTLSDAMSGTTLRLTPATFGPGGIADVLTGYFPPDGTLVIDGVRLTQSGDEVTFANATGAAAAPGATSPLAGTTIAARFVPGSPGVTMTLTAVPPVGWLFSSGWPLLAGAALDQLSVSQATLTFSSVAVPGGAAKGISFAGSIGFPPAWSVLAWLLGGADTLPVAGPVGQRGAAPSFAFSASVGSVNLPVLGSLQVSFAFSSTPVSGAVQPQDALALTFGTVATAAAAEQAGTGPVIYPWVPQIALGVSAQIEIAGAQVPIFIDLSLPDGTVPIVADVSALSLVTLDQLAHLVNGVDLGGALPSPSNYDPGQVFTLRTLAFELDPSGPKLVSVGLVLGTVKPWPITSGLSVGPISVTFLVDIASKQVLASLAGDIGFTGGSLGLSTSNPGWVFAGGLNPGSTIDLAALLAQVVSGTAVPQTLVLDRLDFVVQPLKRGSFSLTTGITGDWSFPVGSATLALTGAWLQLDRQAGGTSTTQTSGTISVQGKLTPPPDTGDPITFDGTWNVPGTLSLNGAFPDLKLTEIAAKISGTTPPAEVPEIDLTKGQVAILLDSTGTYAFAVSASATVNGTTLGGATVAVRKTATAFGFLAGFVVTEGWSPADLWPDLATLFGGLVFANSGLVISTLPAGSQINLPALTMPSLPAAVSPGFTFFTTLKLQGEILGALAGLFDEGVTLNLLAIVDTTTPVNSRFQAIFQGNSPNNAVAWTQIVVTLAPAATTFTIRAAANFTVEGEKLTLAGEGSITLKPPAVSFSLLIENWQHPFGIANLVIKTFGLQFSYKEAAEFNIGLLGSFIIGTGDRSFTLVIGGEIIDFEAPGALIFELEKNPSAGRLMLTDVIDQFTDLHSGSVPVLNAIGFAYLKFAVVDDPAGFSIGGYTFPPGIGIAADIFIYDWEAKFNLQVSWGKGIYASGSINAPITLAGILSLSDVTGKTGPSGLIDTSQLPSRTDAAALERRRDRLLVADGTAQPYFTLDGRLVFLGIDESIKASAAGSTFDFTVDFSFLHAVTAHLECHLADSTHFSAAAAIGFDLDITLGPYSVGGIPLVPQVHIEGPSAALAFGITINPQVIPQLSLGLRFHWSGSDYAVDFTLSVAAIASELTNLWSALKTWLENNVRAVFNEILSDAAKWVEALLGPFSALASDIGAVADALANFFVVSVEDAAALLMRLGAGFMEIVDALVQYFSIALQAAIDLVESLYDDCSMQNAEEQAYGAAGPGSAQIPYTVRDLAFALTASEGGQHLLEIFYCHQAEIQTLLAPHPYLYDRLRSFAGSPQRARDMRLMADTALKALVTIAPQASPSLAAAIDELIPALMRYRDMTAGAVLADLAARS
jgi:hypothetical protein